jgi:hypothetical protein
VGVIGPATVQAQAAECRGVPTVVADACQTARDLFVFAAPQVAVALGGGNPVLGDGSTLGGFGRASLAVRATALAGAVPRDGALVLSAAGARSGDIATRALWLPAVSVEGALGVLPGLLVGLTRIGGVDFLWSGTLVPARRGGTFTLEPEQRAYDFGYGARVGLLQESAVVPGIAVTWQRRRLPRVGVTVRGGDDTLAVRSLAVSADEWRAVISKRILLVGLSAGIGQDAVDARAIVSGVVNDGGRRYALADVVLGETPRRTNVFVDASFGLGGLRVVGELGRSFAAPPGDVLRSFGGRAPGQAFTYASAGLRLGL